MPPYTCPTFEEIEAKEWASSTINSILSDVSPLSFGSDDFYFQSQQKKPTQTVTNETSRKASNPLRRSLSFLEGSLFLSPSTTNKDQKNARRSHSTILPATSTISEVTPQHSVSSNICGRIDHALVTHRTEILENRHHGKSNKSQRAIITWKNTFADYMINPPSYLKSIETKPSTKKSTQLSKFIMAELLTTEETFLNHLLTIKNFYMDPLLDATTSSLKKSSMLVNQKEIEVIFAYIPELIALSSILVERLKTVIDCFNEESAPSYTRIGKIFCDLEPYFDIYILYTVNFSKSKKCLTKASSSIVYRQLVQDSMRKKATNRMLLSDYMIAPIQRITRYCLLLKDLLKHSHPSHPDHVYLEKTLRCLSALAFAMNTVHQ